MSCWISVRLGVRAKVQAIIRGIQGWTQVRTAGGFGVPVSSF